ncbi:MAG: acyltransferase [Oscillospiraceae bacterium]
MVKSKFSYSISWLNFILSIFIVMIHTHFEGKYSQTSSGYELFITAQESIAIFADCAVAAFFAISAYLLFRNFTVGEYLSKLRNKIKTLLIPYIMWSAIGLIYKIIASDEIRFEILNGSIWSALKSLIFSVGNQPLWFLTTLFLFVIISPLIYYVIRWSKFSILLLPVFAIIALVFKIGYTNILFWMPIYLLGAYVVVFEKQHIEVNGIISSNKKLRISLLIINILAIILIYIFGIIFKDNYYLYYLYRVLSVVSIIWLFMQINWKNSPPKNMQNSFFTYCSHACIVGISTKIVSQLFNNNFISMIAGYFISIAITIGISILIAEILKRYLPRVYAILIGGRKDRKKEID